MKKLPLSYIEISKKNLIHNIKLFKKLVGNKTKISAVVKANAYGHGDIEVVKILDPYVDYFQVDKIDELERIRKITKKPIFTFGYVEKNNLEKAIKLGGILSVFGYEHAVLINKIARKLRRKALVHISIDSLLGREGFLLDDIKKVLPKIKKMKNIQIDGVYSHFSNIEDVIPESDDLFGRTTNFFHAEKQIDMYHSACDLFYQHGYKNIKTHISSTSGILVYDNNANSTHSIVRPGLGIYGMWPSEYLEKMWHGKITLKPVLKWVTHVAQVKILPPDYPIGYGLTYVTKKKTKITIIPQGYADGFGRELSNKGEVLISGKRCKVLGRVAMNMFVVDVSHLSKIKAEDEVVIIGKQGKEKISAEEIAQKANTINYEITTKISSLLPRIVK